MHLKITSLGGTIYEGEITKATLPTYVGEITVLPGHQPLTSVIKAGVVSFVPVDEIDPETIQAPIVDGKVHLAVSKGLVLVDGAHVVVTTSAATGSRDESMEVLQQMQEDMEAELAKIKEDGNAQDLEIAIEQMEKIHADIALAKIGRLGR